MPCVPVAGGFAIVCGGRRAKRCTYCGGEGTQLCDAKLLTGPRRGRTCDVPMCKACTFSPRAAVDYCRDHRGGTEA
jgi:hypothetical protein